MSVKLTRENDDVTTGRGSQQYPIGYRVVVVSKNKCDVLCEYFLTNSQPINYQIKHILYIYFHFCYFSSIFVFASIFFVASENRGEQWTRIKKLFCGLKCFVNLFSLLQLILRHYLPGSFRVTMRTPLGKSIPPS